MFLFRGGCTVASWANLPRACKHTVETDPGSKGFLSTDRQRDLRRHGSENHYQHPPLPRYFRENKKRGSSWCARGDGQMEERNVKFRWNCFSETQMLGIYTVYNLLIRRIVFNGEEELEKLIDSFRIIFLTRKR